MWALFPFLITSAVPLQVKEKLDRDAKRASHNFVNVQLPNATCNQCGKVLNYRPSVQCSSKFYNAIYKWVDQDSEIAPGRVLGSPRFQSRSLWTSNWLRLRTKQKQSSL